MRCLKQNTVLLSLAALTAVGLYFGEMPAQEAASQGESNGKAWAWWVVGAGVAAMAALSLLGRHAKAVDERAVKRLSELSKRVSETKDPEILITAWREVLALSRQQWITPKTCAEVMVLGHVISAKIHDQFPAAQVDAP